MPRHKSVAITIKEAKGTETGFLQYIARVVLVAGEPSRVPVRGSQMRKHHFLELLKFPRRVVGSGLPF